MDLVEHRRGVTFAWPGRPGFTRGTGCAAGPAQRSQGPDPPEEEGETSAGGAGPDVREERARLRTPGAARDCRRLHHSQVAGVMLAIPGL